MPSRLHHFFRHKLLLFLHHRLHRLDLFVGNVLEIIFLHARLHHLHRYGLIHADALGGLRRDAAASLSPAGTQRRTGNYGDNRTGSFPAIGYNFFKIPCGIGRSVLIMCAMHM